jgi:hypothetical protein
MSKVIHVEPSTPVDFGKLKRMLDALERTIGAKSGTVSYCYPQWVRFIGTPKECVEFTVVVPSSKARQAQCAIILYFVGLGGEMPKTYIEKHAPNNRY